jgi:Protein of unknown function (DUF3592)
MNFISSFGNSITILVAIPFIIIALVLLRAGLRGRRLAAASKTWPATTGKVLSSEVEARRSSSSTGGYTTSYYPMIFYEYQVDGQIHRSNTLVLGGEVGGPVSRAQQTVIAYPPGSSVQVYYNPENHQQATLEQGSSLSGILIWVAVLIIVGLICTFGFTAGLMGMVGGLVSGIAK